MFLDYYRLSESPFADASDPRFLYFGPTHREALASLYYGIESARGFLALIAKAGMGKTTLLFQLLERPRGSARTAFIFQTQCDFSQLLPYISRDLGVNGHEQDLVLMHERLNEVLVGEARAGRRVVLVIDEAQNLSDTVLESVRLLSDFETPRAKLVQIILAGQPPLGQADAARVVTIQSACFNLGSPRTVYAHRDRPLYQSSTACGWTQRRRVVYGRSSLPCRQPGVKAFHARSTTSVLTRYR